MKYQKRAHPSVTSSAAILLLVSSLWSCAQTPRNVAAANDAILRDQNAKSGYALGVEMGSKLREPGLELNAEAVARGVKDGMTGAETLLSETEMQALLVTLRSDYRQKRKETLRQQRSSAGEGTLARIRFAFKPDPRVSNGTYAATPAWVSPQRFSGTSGQYTIQVMAGGLDSTGQVVPITPTWTPADPDLVDISAGDSDVADITVKRAGESTVTVHAGDISATLVIKAEDRAGVLNVMMTQAP
jgi:hypothetical protein